MYLFILSITLPYFLIGGIGMFLSTRKVDGKLKKERWTKFLFYFIIVHAVYICIEKGFTPFFILIILGFSFYELMSVGIRSGLYKKQVLIYCFCLILFYFIGIGLVGFSQLSKHQILFSYTMIFVFDGFSQICGQLVGKRKLSPRISPNKTIEGAIGGFVFALITSVCVANALEFSIKRSLVLCMLICIACLAGDLAASWYKRKNEIKDYSRLIPRHGGVLDRFDSFISAGSFVWLISIMEF